MRPSRLTVRGDTECRWDVANWRTDTITGSLIAKNNSFALHPCIRRRLNEDSPSPDRGSDRGGRSTRIAVATTRRVFGGDEILRGEDCAAGRLVQCAAREDQRPAGAEWSGKDDAVSSAHGDFETFERDDSGQWARLFR